MTGANRTLGLVATALACGAGAAGESVRSIENGSIRVGVDLSIGGAITHVSDLRRGENLINSHDWGRQIQMSFYGGPHNYQREGKRKAPHWGGFPWNPIQSGDSFGNGSRTLEHRVDGHRLYVKSIPMLWPMENDPAECLFETWITLDANTFRYRGRLTNQRTDTTAYGPFHQEVPAVYTNGVWHRLMTYVGDRPGSGEALTEVRKSVREPWPWSKWLASENWAALVDDQGWGIGAWHPRAMEFHGGFAGRRGSGGPKDGPTGYFAPMHTDILDHNIVYEYECLFIVGSLEEIRATALRQPRPEHPPRWRFERDRCHWTLRHCRDQGWPVRDGWTMHLDDRQAHLESPFVFWRAEEAPRLVIRGSFRTRGRQARVAVRAKSPEVHTTASWKAWTETWWRPDQTVPFTVANDGSDQEITVDLTQAPGYAGALCGLRIELPESAEGDTVRIREITLLEGTP